MFNNLSVAHNINGGSMKRIKLLFLSLMLLSPFNVFAYSDYVIPGGDNIGIELNIDGLLVTGFYKVNGRYNYNGLKIGDYITHVNGIEISDANHFMELIHNEEKVKLSIRRNDDKLEYNFNIIDNKTGIYVKDDITGIGTLTYIDPNSNIFGALGHEVIDGNTKSSIDMSDGIIFRSDVIGIDRSIDGNPGTKNAKFYYNEEYGEIDKNTDYGIYGEYNTDINRELIEVAESSEIELGSAYIRTVIDEEIKLYEIKIVKVNEYSDTKNIQFEIIDEELLSKCGGIVQGMSGSPIIQNDKLIGAVTHVLKEDVSSGYGVFITTMLNEGEN